MISSIPLLTKLRVKKIFMSYKLIGIGNLFLIKTLQHLGVLASQQGNLFI